MPDSATPTGELGRHTGGFWADLAGSAGGGSGSAVDSNATNNGLRSLNLRFIII